MFYRFFALSLAVAPATSTVGNRNIEFGRSVPSAAMKRKGDMKSKSGAAVYKNVRGKGKSKKSMKHVDDYNLDQLE